MKMKSIVAAVALTSLLAGCAASSKAFYASPEKIKNTQLCRTYFDASQKGDQRLANDIAVEAIRRGLTLDECQNKVAAENGVLIATALVATAVGVGIACKNGCAAPSGGGAYRPNYAGVTDVDCLGGTGDGPRFTPNYGPFPINAFNDPFNLDADNDGMACEAGEGGFGT